MMILGKMRFSSSKGSLNVFSGGKGLNQSVALSKAGLKDFTAGDALVIQNEISEPKKIAHRLREKLPGAKIVLTLGAQGAVYSDCEMTFHQEALRVNAVDTTGAGDTFTGFFLSGIFDDKTPQKSLP